MRYVLGCPRSQSDYLETKVERLDVMALKTAKVSSSKTDYVSARVKLGKKGEVTLADLATTPILDQYKGSPLLNFEPDHPNPDFALKMGLRKIGYVLANLEACKRFWASGGKSA